MTTTDSAGPARKEKRRYHHGDLANALKQAAVQLIADRGVSAFTLREATQLAGVTHPAAYRHFEDKASLLASVAEEGFVQLRATMEAARDASSDPLSALSKTGEAFVRFFTESPSHFPLMYGPSSPDRERFNRLHELDMACYRQTMDTIVAGQSDGVIREGDPRELTLVAFSMLHGIVGAHLTGQIGRAGFNSTDDTERVFRTASECMLDALRPH